MPKDILYLNEGGSFTHVLFDVFALSNHNKIMTRMGATIARVRKVTPQYGSVVWATKYYSAHSDRD